MEFAIADIFFASLGWTFLFLKHRDFKKMDIAKHKLYDGSFRVAGQTIALQAALIILGLLTIAIAKAIFSGTLTE